MTKAIQQPTGSIFDDDFDNLIIPIEITRLPGLQVPDWFILCRVIFWTAKGQACLHTNVQFAELIGKSERTAKRRIYKLIERKLLKADYTRHGRKLTALVGVAAMKFTRQKEAENE